MQPLPHTARLYPNVCNLADVSAGHMPFLGYYSCGTCFFHQSSCMRCMVIGCHSVQDALRSLDRPLQQSAANLNSYLQGVSGLPLPVFPADTWLLNTYLDEVWLDQLCHNRSRLCWNGHRIRIVTNIHGYANILLIDWNCYACVGTATSRRQKHGEQAYADVGASKASHGTDWFQPGATWKLLLTFTCLRSSSSQLWAMLVAFVLVRLLVRNLLAICTATASESP